jgi:hypothetical protein
MTTPPATITSATTGNMRAVKVWLIISQVITFIGAILLIAFGIFATLLEGPSPGAYGYMIAAPFFTLVFAILAWIAYKKKRKMIALILTSIPLVIFLLFALFVALITLLG